MYIGTATYDHPTPARNQTRHFKDAGCNVAELKCATSAPEDMVGTLEAADVVIVSGGNTVFAVVSWKKNRDYFIAVLTVYSALAACDLVGGS